MAVKAAQYLEAFKKMDPLTQVEQLDMLYALLCAAMERNKRGQAAQEAHTAGAMLAEGAPAAAVNRAA